MKLKHFFIYGTDISTLLNSCYKQKVLQVLPEHCYRIFLIDVFI